MALTVTYDATAVKAMLAKLPEALRDKASAMAINKTADKAKTEMKRQITAIYNLKSTEVGGALNIIKASAKKNVVSASLYPTTLSGSKKGRAMNVIHFLSAIYGVKTRGSKATKAEISALEGGLGFQFKKIGGTKRIKAVGDKSAPFIGNKGRTVFRRTGKSRTPIEPVQVIDIPQMFNTAALNNSVLQKAATDLVTETDRAVTQVLRTLA